MKQNKTMSPFEKFHAYMSGWRSGAGTRPIDSTLAESPEKIVRDIWREGYEEGVAARVEAQQRKMAEYDYEPSTLRHQSEANAEPEEAPPRKWRAWVIRHGAHGPSLDTLVFLPEGDRPDAATGEWTRAAWLDAPI